VLENTKGEYDEVELDEVDEADPVELPVGAVMVPDAEVDVDDVGELLAVVGATVDVARAGTEEIVKPPLEDEGAAKENTLAGADEVETETETEAEPETVVEELVV